MVSNLKCLLHLQDIYLECKMHNRHGYHPTQGDVHSCLPIQHLVPIKDLCWIEFMFLHNLDSLVKGHAICELGSLWNLWTLKERRNQ
jgi:hypothetical protein